MESIKQSEVILLTEETAVAEARRTAHMLCNRLNLSATAIARAEIVVVELAGNLLRHAQGGRLYLASNPAADALQVIAMDAGPGIACVERALEDGFTTSSTPGLGLGSVGRLSGEFDLYTQMGHGTVISALVGEPSGPQHTHVQPLLERTAVLSTRLEGEAVNGDSWTVYPRQATGLPAPQREIFLLVDGLGHGLHASEAAAMAVHLAQATFAAEPSLPLSRLLERLHGPMRATRGAAIAVVSIEAGVATCCGVGNVSCSLHAPDGTDRSMISNNGTLGHQMRKVQEFQYPFLPGTLLIMHSDGIATRWRFSQYAGLRKKAPATIAGLIYRDAVRGRDDATVLVSRLGMAEANPGQNRSLPGGAYV